MVTESESETKREKVTERESMFTIRNVCAVAQDPQGAAAVRMRGALLRVTLITMEHNTTSTLHILSDVVSLASRSAPHRTATVIRLA